MIKEIGDGGIPWFAWSDMGVGFYIKFTTMEKCNEFLSKHPLLKFDSTKSFEIVEIRWERPYYIVCELDGWAYVLEDTDFLALYTSKPVAKRKV